jgi:hypothetical protein
MGYAWEDWGIRREKMLHARAVPEGAHADTGLFVREWVGVRVHWNVTWLR